MLRRLLLAAAVTVMVPLAAMLAPSAANTARAATCTDGIAVTQFAFNPSTVPPGGAAPLTLVLQNCTSQTIQGNTAWFGSYSPGQGCPVLDAVPFNYTIAPNGTYTLTNTFGAPGFPNCQPTALKISANINENGVVGTVTTVSATLQFVTCTNGIAITQFSFSPATVQGTQTSTLTLVVQNCGSQALQGETVVAPKFTGTGSGLPPGCPVLDPLAFPFSLAPGASSTSTQGLGNPIASCQATGIAVTANVSVSGVTGVAATATANLVIIPSATGGCHVTYSPNNWTGGFTANVTIANNGSSAINGWTLTFAFPGDQKITNWWNAAVTQTGASVTATNLSYNATISPGGSQTFGFQGTWTTSDASPASFSVNGVACT